MRGFRDQEEEEQENEEKKSVGFRVCIDKEPCKSGSVSQYQYCISTWPHQLHDPSQLSFQNGALGELVRTALKFALKFSP